MQSTPNLRQFDDPHDILMVASDAVVIAPTGDELAEAASAPTGEDVTKPVTTPAHDELATPAIVPPHDELARLAQAVRQTAAPQIRIVPDVPVDAPSPAVDTTFRPTTGEAEVADLLQSRGTRTARSFMAALLLASCTGGAAIAWQYYGDAAEQAIVQTVPHWASHHLLALLRPSNTGATVPVQPAPPAVVAAATDAAPPQPALAAQAPPDAVAPASTPSLQAMSDEIAQLKANIAELKASQQQMSHDAAKAAEVRSPAQKTSVPRSSEAKPSAARSSEAKSSEAKSSEAKSFEQTVRQRLAAIPPQPTATAPRVRKPMSSYAMSPLPPPRTAAVVATVPPAPAPVVQQVQPQPQAAAQPQTDPDLLITVPRPPLPLH